MTVCYTELPEYLHMPMLKLSDMEWDLAKAAIGIR